MKSHFGFVLLAAGVLVAGCDKKPAAAAGEASKTETPATVASAPETAKTEPAKPEAPKQEKPQTGNPITAPVDYLGAVVNAGNVAVKKIDVAYIQNAIQLFNAQEGRFPNDLNELVTQKYLGKIPQVPPGMKLQYDAAKGEVSVVKK